MSEVTRTDRNFQCVMCDKTVPFFVVTSDDPECPEMLSAYHFNRWVGVFQDDDGNVRLLVCCSKECVIKFCSG